MRIALWGVGNNLNKFIDDINRDVHTIEYLIDSNSELEGKTKWGMPIKHYKNIELDKIDAIVITTTYHSQVLDIILKEFPQIQIPVFKDTDHFLAYEYVNILHQDVKDNPLYRILEKNHFQYDTDKRLQYLETYDRYFARFNKGKEVVFLEIGVYCGGSLKLWKEYFGSKGTIIGVDINAECEKFREEQIEIEIGSQESHTFWDYIKHKYPHIDIVLDDGGHTMKQQITTFTELFPHLAPNGIYMCEDVFTSYWPEWGGGWKNESSFMEFVKGIADHVNTKFAPTVPFWSNQYAENVKSVCFHQGIVVIEKGNVCKKLDNALLRL